MKPSLNLRKKVLGLLLSWSFITITFNSFAIQINADTIAKTAIYNFNIEIKGNRAILSWQYYSLDSNISFVVERSTDKEIYTVLSITPYPAQSYQTFFYNDDLATAVTYYYRVKEYGNAGGGRYSEIKAVSISEHQTNAVKLNYQGELSIDFGTSTNQDIVIRISDISGRLLYTYSGKTNSVPTITNITSGIYFINAFYGKNSYYEKFAIP